LEGGGYSGDGGGICTPMTASDSGVFNGHLGASGDWSGADAQRLALHKPNMLNNSGDDHSPLGVPLPLGNNTARDFISRESVSHDTSSASAYQPDISVVAGTAAYAPPHSTGSFADDLYSVGIVFFELLHLFRTSMHRATCLRDLRSSGTVPDSFRESFPLESVMIEEVRYKSSTLPPTSSCIVTFATAASL
jgi:hypothetical protein